jgi:hypothetical protein
LSTVFQVQNSVGKAVNNSLCHLNTIQ